MRYLKILNAFRFLIILTLGIEFSTLVNICHAQAVGEGIIANVPDGNQTLIQVYNSGGLSIGSFTLDTQNGQRIIAGKWSPTSSVGVFVQKDSSSTFSTIDMSGAVTSSTTLPDGKVNSIFSGDFDNSGSDDFVAIQHISSKARAIIIYNPGIGGTNTAVIQLPTAVLYYSAAYAGNGIVGFLLYNPESTATLSAKTRKQNRKKKAPKNKKGGLVELVDLQGNLVSKFTISKPSDGQIYPFSPDGLCGFAIHSGNKVKTYSHSGAPISTINLPNSNDALVGDFHQTGLVQEMIVPDGATMHFINLTNGVKTSVTFTGFPDLQASLQIQIDQLRNELLLAFQNGASIIELTKIRNQIVTLEDQKRDIGTLSSVGGKHVRLFTGGVGSIEGICDVVRQNPSDGYGGFLAKNADKDGKAVYLTPGGKNFYGAELIKFKSYKVVANLFDDGFGNPDSNGYRKHFRGKKTLQGYGKTIFRAYLKTSVYDSEPQKFCWFISKSSSRID